jgi:hypothetical protein
LVVAARVAGPPSRPEPRYNENAASYLRGGAQSIDEKPVGAETGPPTLSPLNRAQAGRFVHAPTISVMGSGVKRFANDRFGLKQH